MKESNAMVAVAKDKCILGIDPAYGINSWLGLSWVTIKDNKIKLVAQKIIQCNIVRTETRITEIACMILDEIIKVKDKLGFDPDYVHMEASPIYRQYVEAGGKLIYWHLLYHQIDWMLSDQNNYKFGECHHTEIKKQLTSDPHASKFKVAEFFDLNVERGFITKILEREGIVADPDLTMEELFKLAKKYHYDNIIDAAATAVIGGWARRYIKKTDEITLYIE